MIKKAYINGKFIFSKKKYDIIEPLNNSIIGSVPALTKVEINRAFQAARDAQKKWEYLGIKKRSQFIKAWIKQLKKRKDDLVQMMVDEIAKPISQAASEVDRTIQLMNDIILAYQKIYIKKLNSSEIGTPSKEVTIIRKPLGVVLAISPFNYPVNLSISKIAPALLTGNSVVFKSATNGTLTAAIIAETIDAAKFPKGVFNFVTGRGREIGDVLVQNKEINAIAFTGGEEVGINISQQSTLAILILEMGGKDAAIIRPDADLKNTVAKVIKGSFSYSGQRCTAIKRVFIQKENHDKFISELVQKVSMLTIGDAKDDKDITHVISTTSANYIMNLVKDAIQKGAKALTPIKREGNLIHPLILDQVTLEMDIAWKEQFGPVLPIITVKDDKQAIKLSNESEYGLQASIFTKNIKKARDMALKIDVGSVNINGAPQRGPDILPFTGVKKSGLNVQGVKYSLETMSRPFNIVNNK